LALLSLPGRAARLPQARPLPAPGDHRLLMPAGTPSLRALYDLWAPSYLPAPHNPLMRVEQAAMLRLLLPVAGLRALDLACGTGRYTRILAAQGAAAITSLDFSLGMLRGVCSVETQH